MSPDPDPPPFEPHVVLRTERVYDSPWCGLRRDHLRLEDGAEQEYHVFEVPDAVCVVPETADGRIAMIWQHRHPHGRSHWEVPAGRIHDGERPEVAGAREVLEETGHRVGRMDPLPSFYPINGISGHFCHLFVARGCVPVAEPDLEAAERISVHVTDREEVRRRLLAGEYADGFTALALLWYFGAALA